MSRAIGDYNPSHNSNTKPEQLLYEFNSETSLFHTRIFQPDQNKRKSQKTHLFAQLSNRLGDFNRLQGLLYFMPYFYQAGMPHMANTRGLPTRMHPRMHARHCKSNWGSRNRNVMAFHLKFLQNKSNNMQLFHSYFAVPNVDKKETSTLHCPLVKIKFQSN